jgi:hypothetical protein
MLVGTVFSVHKFSHQSSSLPQVMNFPQAASCASDYGQCGGQGYTGTTCCSVPSTVCEVQNPYYSQCKPHPPQSTGCSADYQQCGGAVFTGPTCCAVATSFCSTQNEYYSQCLPLGSIPFPVVFYDFNNANEFAKGIVENQGLGLYDGIVSGGVVRTQGPNFPYVTFNDVDGVVTVQNSENLGTQFQDGFTLSAKVKRTAVTSEDGIIGKNYGSDQFGLAFYGGELTFFVVSADTTCAPMRVTYVPTTAYLNRFVDVKAVFKPTSTGTRLKLTFDGVVTTANFACHGLASGFKPITIGNTNGNTDWADFRGSIASVKIYAAAF